MIRTYKYIEHWAHFDCRITNVLLLLMEIWVALLLLLLLLALLVVVLLLLFLLVLLLLLFLLVLLLLVVPGWCGRRRVESLSVSLVYL